MMPSNTAPASRLKAAEAAGRRAFIKGAPEENCPYSSDTPSSLGFALNRKKRSQSALHAAWRKGWEEARDRRDNKPPAVPALLQRYQEAVAKADEYQVSAKRTAELAAHYRAQELESRKQAGTRLIEIKRLIGHGGWYTWLEEHQIAKSTASYYMRLAGASDEQIDQARAKDGARKRAANRSEKPFPSDLQSGSITEPTAKEAADIVEPGTARWSISLVRVADSEPAEDCDLPNDILSPRELVRQYGPDRARQYANQVLAIVDSACAEMPDAAD